MKRAEFIKAWTDAVDAGRVKHYPDMSPAVRAVESVGDADKAAQLWRKHRRYYSGVTVEQFKADELKAAEDDPQPPPPPRQLATTARAGVILVTPEQTAAYNALCKAESELWNAIQPTPAEIETARQRWQEEQDDDAGPTDQAVAKLAYENRARLLAATSNDLSHQKG